MVADCCCHPGWESRAALHHSRLSEAINDGSATVLATLSQMMASDMTREQAQSMINQQGYTMAVTDVFSLLAVLFFALVAMVWLSKPTLGAGAGDAGGAH